MGNARAVWIDGPAGRLEGMLRESPAPRAAAVVAHPHPLYGGTLHNPVVFHADRELHHAGLTTLRFNFRGVGRSEGLHDDGRGETEDVGAVAAWLRGRTPGVPHVLVGYSFGSRCCVGYAASDRSVRAVVAIGFPVRLWDLSETTRLDRPFAVVQGTRDEFGPIDEVERVLDRMVPKGRLYRIEGAEHLFIGRAPEVAARVVEAVGDLLSDSSPGAEEVAS